jgi:hypothetical protein
MKQAESVGGGDRVARGRNGAQVRVGLGQVATVKDVHHSGFILDEPVELGGTCICT